MNKYAGLCIGGPLEGVNAVCEKTRLHAPVNVAVLGLPFDDRPTRIEIAEYKHTDFNFADGTKVGFWIPSDKDDKWAMRQLMDTYSEARA